MWPFFDEDPVFQAINAATERAPVIPHKPSRSISAAISTICPSMALRWPANSSNFSNNTSSRAARGALGTKDGALEDMTPSLQEAPTNPGHAIRPSRA
ncbi:hypothetical protein MLIT_08540 [Mycolicibacterium litorale]|uniref:Uncharacterized protein n=1 Tax=Mycolicibacterium litorale TaxID=758802 RepID=A0AAD1IKH7_9MYCO|nr:hypothetical protein MLIT_08540 [Mycolicibacterium litorale]